MRFRRFLVALALIEASIIGSVVANPQVYDCGEPIALIAERVDISVGENQSAVSGQYSFRMVTDACPYGEGEPITIRVPIIVPGGQSFPALKSSTAVSVRLGRRAFHPSRASVDSPLYDLPSGWKLCSFDFEIPRPAARSVFTIALRYNQPHLPGNISPYYPIHPPEAGAPKSVIRYSVAERGSLVLVSKGETVFEVRSTHISIHPQHHKLILVRVNTKS
jgi:hypothetical protein